MGILNKIKAAIPIIIVIAAGALSACGTPTANPTSTALPTTMSGVETRLEVTLFYSPDNCACMQHAKSLIETTINADYRAQLDSAVLVYKAYNADDPANASLKHQFGASSLSLYFSDVHGTVIATKEYTGLWFYLDTSLTNETLTVEFTSLLKKQIDKHLSAL